MNRYKAGDEIETRAGDHLHMAVITHSFIKHEYVVPVVVFVSLNSMYACAMSA